MLVLEEAGALRLLTPFVVSALQELRKAGLAVHLITQSTFDFGDRNLFEAVLANTPWQAWYQLLSPADQELGARVLTNATFDPHTVHYTRSRALHNGVATVKTESHGESYDSHNPHAVRHNRQTATAFRTKYQPIFDAYYKTPQLWEQEHRTKLATLRIGERFVRDRHGVRFERVTPVRAPWRHSISDLSTRALIARLRQQPIYQDCPPPEPSHAVDEAVPDAAVRMRQQTMTPPHRATPPDAPG